jgi:hypothetical protein
MTLALRSILDNHLSDSREDSVKDDEEKFVFQWNNRAMIHESSRSKWTKTGRTLMQKRNSAYKTYTERDKLDQDAIELSSVTGGEVGLTAHIHATLGELVNFYVNHAPNFKDYDSLPVRQCTLAPLSDSGTSDIIFALPVPKDLVRPVLFQHRSGFSFNDLICLMVAAQSPLELVWDEDEFHLEGPFAHLIKANLKAILAQVRLSLRIIPQRTNPLSNFLQAVEQMQAQQARYIVLGAWDFYLVLFLSSKHEIKISNVVIRDPDFGRAYFDPDELE